MHLNSYENSGIGYSTLVFVKSIDEHGHPKDRNPA